MTVLEAHVANERWSDIRAEYARQTAERPPQMVATYLVQSASDPTLWRVISLWKSRQALEEMRQTTATPGGVLVFRAAGAEPKLSIYDIAASA